MNIRAVLLHLITAQANWLDNVLAAARPCGANPQNTVGG